MIDSFTHRIIDSLSTPQSSDNGPPHRVYQLAAALLPQLQASPQALQAAMVNIKVVKPTSSSDLLHVLQVVQLDSSVKLSYMHLTCTVNTKAPVACFLPTWTGDEGNCQAGWAPADPARFYCRSRSF